MSTTKLTERYDHNEVELRLSNEWVRSKVFAWDSSQPRQNTFVIDTPPPTVSGSLHVGHVFSYTQTDIIARFQRMRGKSLFYPIGWDDNGLPTERRVQDQLGIRCAPSLPYDPEFKPKWGFDPKKGRPQEVSRRNFVEACALVTEEDEKKFEALFLRLGLSVDWALKYETINEHCQKTSQRSFLDLFEKGFAYLSESPTMWDLDDRCAIAQAELEDRTVPGAYHDIRFGVEGGGELLISTTRPELLGSCIAVVAHPDDKRYQPLFGKNAITPLFHSPVPIRAATHADPEKGTGILMVCTFGDGMDVEWWKQSGMPIRQTIETDGTLRKVDFGGAPFASLNPTLANKNYAELATLSINKAREKIVALLAAEGSAVDGKSTALVGEPKPITHPVKYYERGRRPIEFIPTRQWFIKLLDHKDALLAQGRKIKWHPEYMRVRYENWVNGLNQDWCYSRQRFFGVPFPIWYRVDESGAINYDDKIVASLDSLPIDPSSDVPPGYSESQRGQPGGFVGDPDVMDTWSTSSVSPQIQSHWGLDDKRHKQLFPMDIRPQAHEIIRTWAFYTIAKAWMHEDQIPWHNALISGWVLDPNKKKMSKSKGNVVTPEALLEEHSSDAIRYWAGRARLGVDTAFDANLLKIGRRLSTKLFNASRFVVSHFERLNLDPTTVNPADISAPLDCALIEDLRGVISQSTTAFTTFEFAAALQVSEEAFWNFCDNYLELVKARVYSEEDSAERRSALATLSVSLEIFLRLFAPALVYVTEEIWGGTFAAGRKISSVHRAKWPEVSELAAIPAPPVQKTYAAACEVIGHIRGAKTAAKRGLKWPVSKLEITGSLESRNAIEPALSDLLRSGNVQEGGLSIVVGEPTSGQMFTARVELAEESGAANPA